jgi:hypothetical protein
VFDHLAIHADILVLILGATLYLTDLARLLHTNEVLFVGRASGPWSALTPGDGLRFNRKHAVLARPYDPGVVTVRQMWPSERSPDENYRKNLESQFRRLFVPRHLCTLLLPEIFLGIPIAYSVLGNSVITLAILAVIYLQILWLIGWLIVSRKTLQLSWKTCLLLAFESLVCIPYAINLHRKIAEQLVPTNVTDALGTSRQLLNEEQQLELKRYVRTVVGTQLERGANNTPTLSALQSRLDEEIGK